MSEDSVNSKVVSPSDQATDAGLSYVVRILKHTNSYEPLQLSELRLKGENKQQRQSGV